MAMGEVTPTSLRLFTWNLATMPVVVLPPAATPGKPFRRWILISATRGWLEVVHYHLLG